MARGVVVAAPNSAQISYIICVNILYFPDFSPNMSNYFDNKRSFLEPEVRQYGSHTVMSNVVKPTRTKYLNIDTKYRDETTVQSVNTHVNSASTAHKAVASCSVLLPEKVNDVKSISVRTAEIPMTMYNISTAMGNNTLKIYHIVSGVVLTTKVIIIPSGVYTESSLVAKIGDILNADADSVYDTDITVSVTAEGRTSFVSAYSSFRLEFDVNGGGEKDALNFKNKLGWILGYRNPVYTFTQGYPAVSEDLCFIHQTKYLYLVLDELSKGNQQSFIAPMYQSLVRKNIIAKIVLNRTAYPFGSILPANVFNGYLMSDRREYNGKTDLQKLLVQLVDDAGRIVDLNGVDFSFTLEIEYE